MHCVGCQSCEAVLAPSPQDHRSPGSVSVTCELPRGSSASSKLYRLPGTETDASFTGLQETMRLLIDEHGPEIAGKFLLVLLGNHPARTDLSPKQRRDQYAHLQALLDSGEFEEAFLVAGLKARSRALLDVHKQDDDFQAEHGYPRALKTDADEIRWQANSCLIQEGGQHHPEARRSLADDAAAQSLRDRETLARRSAESQPLHDVVRLVAHPANKLQQSALQNDDPRIRAAAQTTFEEATSWCLHCAATMVFVHKQSPTHIKYGYCSQNCWERSFEYKVLLDGGGAQ
jgi:hypothetical protein